LPAEPRVRFSPAPSGSLHIGSARTALFNWLFARHTGGTFVLRIEDTDAERSTDDSVAQIVQSLAWLGVDWDEGPVHQSGRSELYRAATAKLLASGDAYECWCTEAELEARAEVARAEGRTPGYDGHCRDLTEDERAAYRAEGRASVVRFRTPDTGDSTFHDIVRGEVSVAWSSIHDFVIQRADGSPIFFLANAVDDIDMRITHVIRGEDLLDSTHRVLALRRALGADAVPEYAHLPLIVDAASRAKLSKRHGAVAFEELRDEGFLPEALMNYIALLGWSPAGGGDGDEVLTRDELVAEFDLTRVTHAAAGFDRKKLEWLNGEWIRRIPLDELVARAEPLARAAFGDRYDAGVVAQAVAIAQERAVTLVTLVDSMRFLFVSEEDFTVEPASWAKVEATEGAPALLDAVIAHLEGCAWDVESIDLRPTIEALGTKPRRAMPALYAAVEGRHQGLPLFDSLHLLGRERSVARLRAARERLGRATRDPVT
jgi:glutamyl-tRNA synthetase